jgi:hypothetical protein
MAKTAAMRDPERSWNFNASAYFKNALPRIKKRRIFRGLGYS